MNTLDLAEIISGGDPKQPHTTPYASIPDVAGMGWGRAAFLAAIWLVDGRSSAHARLSWGYSYK